MRCPLSVQFLYIVKEPLESIKKRKERRRDGSFVGKIYRSVFSTYYSLVFGLGGYHITLMREDEREVRRVRERVSL